MIPTDPPKHVRDLARDIFEAWKLHPWATWLGVAETWAALDLLAEHLGLDPDAVRIVPTPKPDPDCDPEPDPFPTPDPDPEPCRCREK